MLLLLLFVGSIFGSLKLIKLLARKREGVVNQLLPKTLKENRIYALKIGGILSMTFFLIAFNIKKPLEDLPKIDYYDQGEEPLEWQPKSFTVEVPVPEESKPKKQQPPMAQMIDIIQKKEVEEKSDKEEEIADLEDIEDIPDEIAPSNEVDSFIIFPDRMPEFPGGQKAMSNFLKSNIIYPDFAISVGKRNITVVQFVVHPDGSLSDIKVLNEDRFGFDKESIRVVNLMPNWIPGENNGRKVPVRMQLPIKYRIN